MDSVRSGAFGHLFRPDNFIFGKCPLSHTDGRPQTSKNKWARPPSPRPLSAEVTLHSAVGGGGPKTETGVRFQQI